MKKYLYEAINKHALTDKINEAINETIDEYIEQDVYYNLAPYLSPKKEIKKDSNYFSENRISIHDRLNDRERKTVSYLAPLFKNKVAHNPKEIYRYFWLLGHDILPEDVEVMVIKKSVFDNGGTFDESEANEDCASFIEYLGMINENVTLVANVSIDTILRRKNISGFDKYFDRITLN